MRSSLTPSEDLLGLAFAVAGSVVFRRQIPLVGRFIAAFLAPAALLGVESDGGHHAEQLRADARRDAVLARAG